MHTPGYTLGSKIQYILFDWVLFFEKLVDFWYNCRSQVKRGKRGKIYWTGFYWIFGHPKKRLYVQFCRFIIESTGFWNLGPRIYVPDPKVTVSRGINELIIEEFR